MSRLPRSRRGKTAVDVTITRQNGLARVRLTMGEKSSPSHKNTDMDDEEVENLIVLLSYKLKMMRGEIPWQDD
jgi:hypothetical protein